MYEIVRERGGTGWDMFIGKSRGERKEVECGFPIILEGGRKRKSYLYSLSEREGEEHQ